MRRWIAILGITGWGSTLFAGCFTVVAVFTLAGDDLYLTNLELSRLWLGGAELLISSFVLLAIAHAQRHPRLAGAGLLIIGLLSCVLFGSLVWAAAPFVPRLLSFLSALALLTGGMVLQLDVRSPEWA